MADDNLGSAFSREQVRNVLQVRDATRDIQDAMKKAFDGRRSQFKELNIDMNAVAGSANKFADAQERAKKSSKSVNELLKEEQKLKASAAKFAAEINKIELKRERKLKEIAAIQEKANKTQEGKLKGIQKEQIRVLEEEISKEETKLRLVQDARENTMLMANDYKTLAKESNKLGKSIYSNVGSIAEFFGISGHITDGFKEANEEFRARKIGLQEQAEFQEKINKLVEIENKKRAKNGEELITNNDLLEKGVGLTDANVKAAQAQGIDVTEITGGKTGEEGASRLRTRSDDLAKDTPGQMQPLLKMFKGFGQALKTFAKAAIALKAIAAVTEMIQYALFGVDKEITEIAREFSISKEAAAGLRENIRKAAEDSKIFGANTENLLKMQMAFTKHTGMAVRLNEDQLSTMSMMTRQLALSEETAIKLTEAFKVQGLTSEEGLDNLYNQHRALLESGKTAMTFKQLTEDIAGDTELMFIFQTRGAEAAMKNAAAVRRTGLSLAQQRSMAEGTLDFEKTMTNQLELQLLTGKNINMQRAMQLSLQGKNGAAVAEMQKQMRGLTAEQRKNPLIMNKMLEMLGTSREEYYEMIKAQQQQAAAEKAMAAAKEKFRNDEINGQAKYDRMLKDGYDEAIRREKALDRKKGESMEKEMQAIYERMDENDEANFRQMTQEERKAAVLQEYHDTQLHNAKVRAGVTTEELKNLQANVSASEAFELAMAEVKDLFTDLVGSGAIQDLTSFIVDFVTRAKQVGFMKAALGYGSGQEAIDEEVGAGTFDAIKSLNTAKEGTEAEKKGIDAVVDTIRYAGKGGSGAGTDEDMLMEALSTVKSQADFDKISKAYKDKYDVTLMEELKSELNFNEIADVMQAINQQAVKAGAGMVFDIQAATAARTKDTQFRGSSYQFDKDFDVSDYQYQTPANDFIFRQGQAPMKFNKNDLVIGGTNLGGSGDGKVAALLERLVSAVEAGGDVIMDGNKVGTTIAMTKSKFK